MPLYEYELCEGDCIACGGRFTLRRPLSAKPLTHCPACKKPVRKLISTFNSPLKLKPVSISDAKAAGFTVLDSDRCQTPGPSSGLFAGLSDARLAWDSGILAKP
jgi:putative FmdB family regulatory protein